MPLFSSKIRKLYIKILDCEFFLCVSSTIWCSWVEICCFGFEKVHILHMSISSPLQKYGNDKVDSIVFAVNWRELGVKLKR